MSCTKRSARPVNRTCAFAINSEFDDVFADIETRPAAIDNQQGSLSISYEARIAHDADQHGVVLKDTSRF